MNNILIIGGMGPQASLELHSRIVERAAANGARSGHEFPSITHLSLPIEDFINCDSKPVALETIKRALVRLYLWQGRSDRAGLQHSASVFAAT